MTEYEQPKASTNSRTLPLNELDLTFMTTEPAWGKEIPEELNYRLSRPIGKAYEDDSGKTVIDTEPLWGLLAMYTRDLRLGNLSAWNGEIEVCNFWLVMAGDLLRDELIEAFFSAMSRVISMLEISQSKNGFLRKRHGTITQEKTGGSSDGINPARRGLMGGKKQK